MKHLLMDQCLPSGCGFRVVRVKDGEEDPLRGNFAKLKKWCKTNCSGVWGYSANEFAVYNEKTYKMHYTRYFAFVDESDILAVALFMGLDEVSIKAMWPERTQFMIFYQDDE